MPAAAVIPAPIAYIKIAAVKASVVEFRLLGSKAAFTCDCLAFSPSNSGGLRVYLDASPCYFEQIGVLQPSGSLNSSAWNNRIGFRSILLVS